MLRGCKDVVEIPSVDTDVGDPRIGVGHFGLALIVNVDDSLTAFAVCEDLLGPTADHGVYEIDDEEAEGDGCPQRPVLEQGNGGERYGNKTVWRSLIMKPRGQAEQNEDRAECGGGG